MRKPPRSSLRARIVLAFVAFAALVGTLFALLGWWFVQRFEPAVIERLGVPVELALFGGGVLIALFGALLGSYTARRVLRPVEELGELAEVCKPQELADELGRHAYDKEIGVLAWQLEDAMRRLQQFVEREQRFTRYASHELRSPVAVIKGAAEILRARATADGDETMLRPLERIERSVEDMEAIIEAFLWLGRERSELEPVESCAVLPVVRKTISKYEHLLTGRPVEVELHTTGDPSVEAPPTVVAMVVGNLIANAFHYTPAGKVTVEVAAHAVSVADEGLGMDIAALDRCTESFVRGDKSVGYGLGLSIVQSLCDRFGWWLELDSEPGAGTTATLRF